MKSKHCLTKQQRTTVVKIPAAEAAEQCQQQGQQQRQGWR
jgi:hypothetical protein